MKYALTILLVAIMASTQTPLGQFLKLPFLIEHYIKHGSKKEISVFTFLFDHYLTNHNDSDFPEDQKLPFKTNTFLNLGYAIIPSIYQQQVSTFVVKQRQFIRSDTNSRQIFLSGIFHPPRI